MREIEKEINFFAPILAKEIRKASNISHNEAEFRTKITSLINDFAEKAKLNLHLREEYTLINGRADAVYNRLIIEYEPPGSLKDKNSYRTNIHAIEQVKAYMEELVKVERHKPERVAGVVLDGTFFIFVRWKNKIWYIDPPLRVDGYSTNRFLKLLSSLSTEKALIPENLVEDFGENRYVSRKMINTLFNAIRATTNQKVKTLYEQWRLHFSEVSDYEEASKINIVAFAKNFGISEESLHPFDFFFCLHTYYTAFIKLLAVQIVHYYTMPKFGTDLKQAINLNMDDLKSYLTKIEQGGIFKELGISNFIEGNFFSWYLDIWNEELFNAFKSLINALANYSLVTLDIDPDTTKDLLKKIYQQIMPKKLRHNLGEYYTPDWLAERLLNMLEAGKFEGDPDKRILDPACGSGTFLVMAIKKMKEYGWKNAINESILLEKILNNVVGFDLNPLAVISSRVNYLLALGELLQFKNGEINIPVYISDSIMTPQEGEDLFGKGIVKFNTAVGPFSFPKSLVKANYVDLLSNFLEEAVNLDLDEKQFKEKLTYKLPLNMEQDRNDIDIIYQLYEKLLNLEKQGVNGIWARIIKNAFAPLFVGEFDYIAGNPPWINWEHLPENYRLDTKKLWENYGLFPHGGMDTILGKGKKDISMIMTFVSMDKYLKKGGKLGFLITQSVFKTAGSGQGFRRFKLGEKGLPIKVIHVDDLSELNPFEGASNRTSVVIIQKGRKTTYPVPYTYWKKSAIGKTFPLEASLDEALAMTDRKQFVAEPVNENDITSPWITGRKKALNAIKKVLGQSDYVAHAGCYSGGINSIYWVDIIDKRADGLVIISNITEGQKKKVESIQAAIESDLLYPLLRGRDVKRWLAEPKAWIIMVQDPKKRRGIDEYEMKANYPKTYLYLKRFEKILRERKSRGVRDMIQKGAPFYTMFAVGEYTFAPYKVAWTRISTIASSVITQKNNKPIIPQETVTLVSLENKDEAFYLCAMINSLPFQFAATSYSQEGGKSMGSPHVLENIRIPKFNPKDSYHMSLAILSERAHELAREGNLSKLHEIENEIDEIAAKIWDITRDELKEIKTCLNEISK
ncbi:MAG: N-6 DNA methylase [Deltaproteobacteria bacterium]|nr:N-6 DNA methylase [Deltaproteobacteria bacterium]